MEDFASQFFPPRQKTKNDRFDKRQKTTNRCLSYVLQMIQDPRLDGFSEKHKDTSGLPVVS